MATTVATSSRSTAGTSWLLRASLRYQWKARHVASFGVGVFAVVLLAAAAQLLNANGFVAGLAATIREGRVSAGELRRALGEPLQVVEQPDGSVIVDNPLRYEYELARDALAMMDPIGMALTAAQIATILLPPAVAILAVVLVTRDYRFATLRIRAARFPLPRLQVADLVSVLVVSLTTVAVGVALAAGLSPLLRALAPQQPGPATFGALPATPVADLVAWLGTLAAMIVFSAVLGVGLGLLTRRVLVCAVVLFVGLFLLPRVFAWDPRNLWLILLDQLPEGSSMVDLGKPIAGPGTVGSAVGLVVTMVAVLVAGHLVSRRVTRFTKAP